MIAFDRRRFLQAVTVAAIVGAPSAIGGARPTTRAGWQYRATAEQGSSFAHARRTDDGYLVVGGARDEPYTTEGSATALDTDGGMVWNDRYLSEQQRDAREREVATGPIPEDWLSFSLEADDGALLVGWTYYDNTAVDVARVYRVGPGGGVREVHDLGDLEDTAAYSHLADGIETDGGFLCCGIESPGISLGGAGWLVWLADDGSVARHERYPATDRDIEQTTRRDVFNAITATDGGYVVAGACEPERDDPAYGWVVGLDGAGGVRWDDRFTLPGDGPTVVYDVAASESDAYDLLVVGATGTPLQRATATGIDAPPGEGTRIEGDGFVAAYTDGGERRWIEALSDTPLFCAETAERGVVAGGARDGRAWVGTVSRTDFHADREGVVASLCPSHGGGLIAAGRTTDGDRVEGWVDALEGIGGDESPGEEDDDEGGEDGKDGEEATDDETDDGGENGDEKESEERSQPDDEPETDDEGDERDRKEDPVEFLDCRRVRVIGDFDDVILSLLFEAEDGLPGTITEPIGGVDGERVIDGAAEFGLPPEATVLTAVELFEADGVATPGLGDIRAQNPDLEQCRSERLGEILDEESPHANNETKAANGDAETDDEPEPAAEDDE